MSEKPHFLARKIQNYQRQAARGYICPICSQYYPQEPKIWEHALRAHLEVLGISSSTEQNDIRKKFRNEAMERAWVITRPGNPSHLGGVTNRSCKPHTPRKTGFVTTAAADVEITRRNQAPRRANRDAELIRANQSSNDNDSTRPNIGDEAASPFSPRPSSAPGPTTETRKEIDDIKDLQLSPEQDTVVNATPPGNSPASSPINPLKRGAVAESDPQGASFDPTSYRVPSNRRTKTLSGGLFINKEKDPDFRRDVSNPKEPNTARNPHGPAKRLFDPNTDNPGSPPGFRSNKQDHTGYPRRFYDTRTHVFRSRRTPGGENGDFKYKIMINSSFNDEDPAKRFDMPSTQPVVLEERCMELPNETDPELPDGQAEPELEPEILLQPETRPISHDQLVVEVKGIYAGLVMLEAKCIDVDEKQFLIAQEKGSFRLTSLSNEQWQALIILHKTLLHEHHDFFLASQHPSASSALSRLAAKYSMPARMWRHGIHAFLEVLRHRLPESLEHMLAFIYIAYSMMALLYETVPTFEDTWVECLGDLGRYRMAIEEADLRDREVWSGVARFWYSKAADKSPNIGRLYHHLAILARPYTLQQLSFYTRSLTCVTPFESAKASVMTLFTPILNGKESSYHRSSSFETVFIKAHGILFCGRPSDEFNECFHQIKDNLLDNYIGRVTAKFKEQGVFVAIACIASLFEYGFVRESGSPRSIFRLAFEEIRAERMKRMKTASQQLNDEAFDVNDPTIRSSSVSALETLTPSDIQSSLSLISQASSLAFTCLSIALSRLRDKNIFPLVHVYLVFLWSLAAVETAMKYVEHDVPWAEICAFLNTLAKPNAMPSRVQRESFPKPDEGIGRPLPEDFIIRGQMYSQEYFPETWFEDAMIDDEERVLELPSMAETRAERIVWLGFRLVSVRSTLAFTSLHPLIFKVSSMD